MFCQESEALGGILITHKLEEGKHEYKVENVVKYQKTSREKTFARYSTDATRNVNVTYSFWHCNTCQDVVIPVGKQYRTGIENRNKNHVNDLNPPCAVTINKENIEIKNLTWTAAKINNGNHWTKKKKKGWQELCYTRERDSAHV